MESGDPPAPGRRTNASCLPSGDHLGDPSRHSPRGVHEVRGLPQAHGFDLHLASSQVRGDAPGFVEVLDERTLLIPDLPGNNRLDSLANIVRNPEVGLLFLIPGVTETLRVNGRARIVAPAETVATRLRRWLGRTFRVGKGA